MGNPLTRRFEKIAYSAVFFALCAFVLIGCAGTQEPQKMRQANRQTTQVKQVKHNFTPAPLSDLFFKTPTKVDLNSSYAMNVNNFFDLHTGYSEEFTPSEEAKIKKGWELQVKYNPVYASSIIDFVMSENNGRKIPVYRNFSKPMTIDGYSTSLPKLYKELGRTNYSSYFNTSDIKIKERQYVASDRIGFITIEPENLDKVYYLAKGKNPILDESWEKPDIAFTFCHEAIHLAIAIKKICLPQDMEEGFVMSKTNKIRKVAGKPLRANHEGFAVVNANSKNDPAWDEKKYNYVVDLMIESISFLKDSPRWKYAENMIVAKNQELLSREIKTGQCTSLSLKQLQEQIEIEAIKNSIRKYASK